MSKNLIRIVCFIVFCSPVAYCFAGWAINNPDPDDNYPLMPPAPVLVSAHGTTSGSELIWLRLLRQNGAGWDVVQDDHRPGSGASGPNWSHGYSISTAGTYKLELQDNNSDVMDSVTFTVGN